MRLPSSGPELSATLRQHAFSIIAFATFALLFWYFIFDPFGGPYIVPEWHPAVVHTVLFQFKSHADPDAIQNACNSMMALKDTCLNPSTSQPYIKSIKGGRDNSIESLQAKSTHGFVVEFATSADRDYYVEMDPAHQAFKKIVRDLVDGVIVVDFENGQW